MNRSLRFYDIDGLRFLAAFMVVMYHYTFRGFAADDMSPLAFEGFAVVTRYGYLGVDLFFIISGFVILMTAQSGDPVRFVISRVVRIYPAFWVGLCLTGAFMFWYNKPPFAFDWQNWLLNFPLIGSYVGVPYLDGVYWSLLVELKFYFLVFIMLILGQIDRMTWFLVGWAILTAIMHVVGGPGALHFFFFPEWSHYFIAGATFYLIRTQGLSALRAALVLGSFILSCHSAWLGIAGSIDQFDAGFSYWAIVAFIAAFYLVFMAIALGWTSWVNWGWLTPIGALTYPLYLLHQNIGFILLNTFAFTINKYVLLVLVIAFAVLVSWLVNELVEQRVSPPLKKWLTRITAAIPRPAKSASR